jgi:hypothetical protein
MDGLWQKEMCFDVRSEGRDERPACPLPYQRTREPRVPTSAVKIPNGRGFEQGIDGKDPHTADRLPPRPCRFEV